MTFISTEISFLKIFIEIKILLKYYQNTYLVNVESREPTLMVLSLLQNNNFSFILVKTHYFSTLSLRQGPNIRSLNHFKVMSGRCWITKAVDGKLTSSKNYSHVKPFECWGSTRVYFTRDFIFSTVPTK